ncbi:ABC transporter substrate-binding protein [Wenzhouxiangella sp. XN201]|uniref:ABC transporter substrate-binding protein n=1 Tax=Wenzhouxiangella sp. XN201 TaxID=2710755 RepID=UPI0013C61EBB|nr:ABC transporter substrate-binding protein [Wenzhouxiangella sp. XN201]NEZ03761.1 ABC transporter substrate-binding protein [Wenzhouxiangella sp. XN201]
MAIAPLLALLLVNTLHAQQSRQATHIASAVYLGDVPTIVADEYGLFADQGIQVEVTHHDSGVTSMAKLRAGEADFALMALTPLVLDRLADENPGGPDDPVVLASLVHSMGLLQIVTTSESGIRQPADFRGRRIAVDRGTNSEFVWWLYEQYHGIDRASIELVDLSFADMSDALIAGRIDAAVLVEPRVSTLDARLKEDSRPQAVHFHVNNLYIGKWILVTTRHTVENRPDLSRNMLAAYQAAIDFVDREPNDAIAAFNRRMGVAEGLLAGHWDALDYNLTLDWGLIADFQKQFLWAQAVGYDNAGGPLRILDLIEAGPLRDVRPDAVGIPGTDTQDRTP